MKYIIRSAYVMLDLEYEVTELLNQGWELVGGVSVVNTTSTIFNYDKLYTQALRKR